MMPRMAGKRLIQILGLLAAVMTFGFTAGTAGAATITADPTCCTFTAGPFTQAPGEQSVFDNPPEGAFHNVTSTSRGPDGGDLFISETVRGGSNVPVAGTEYLAAGTYPFVCTLHPGMNGDLVVGGSGTAVPRPSVTLAVPSQKLKQIQKTRKVKVKVKARSLSKGVTVRLLKGKQKLSAPVKLNLAAGATKTVVIKLNAAGRKAVKNVKKGKKLNVAVSSTVPFGKPARASRNLR